MAKAYVTGPGFGGGDHRRKRGNGGRRLLWVAGLCVCALGSGLAARAATTVYTNEVDFLAATVGLPACLNEFTNLDYYGPLAHSIRISTNGIGFYLATAPRLHLTAFPGALSTVETNDQIVATFTSGNVTGVGGWFFSADTNAAPATGAVTLTLSSGDTATVASSAGNPAAFFGFVSDGPIFTSLSVTNSAGGGFPALGHVYVVDGIPAPVVKLNAGGGLLISWGAAPAGFGLQGASSVNGSGWTNVTQTPQTNGNEIEVTLPAAAGAGFFRLKK